MNASPTERVLAKRTRRRARGFTLVEVILSAAIVVVIMAAVTGVMFVAQRGLSSGAEAADNNSQQNRVMQMINMDLSLATSVTERTDRSITIVVPDRNADGQPETIRYAWSGVAGAPLTRQVNGGTVAFVAENVYQFKLSYLLKTLTPLSLLPLPAGPQYAFACEAGKEGCACL